MPDITPALVALARPWSRLIRSFVAVPAFFAVVSIALAAAVLAYDRGGAVLSGGSAWLFPPDNPDTARTLLSVVAGSMVTVLSLVYSLTLIVFTLAAGNIGPRLIERFTNDRTTQVTAGFLVGTFVYAVVVLSRFQDDAIPRTALFCALLLTGMTLVSLIVFIRSVADRVSIDTEIGRVSAQLRAELRKIAVDEEVERRDIAELRRGGAERPVESRRAGYLTALDAGAICAAARRADAFVEMKVRHGDFVIAGQEIAVVTGTDNPDDLAAAICTAMLLESRRTADSDAEFSVHLLVEIAMRALSPGVNDSYTAIACIDQLSSALALPVRGYPPSPLSSDSDGEPRLWFDGVSVETLAGTALHPLRRAAAGNVTVTLRLVRAIGRLAEVTRPSHAPVLERHLRLILKDARRDVANTDDMAEIEAAVTVALDALAAGA